MVKRLFAALVIGTAVFASNGANAATLSFSDITDPALTPSVVTVTDPTGTLFGDLDDATGTIDVTVFDSTTGDLGLEISEDAELTFTFLGSLGGFLNEFSIPGGSFDNETNTAGDSFTINLTGIGSDPSLVPFTFATNSDFDRSIPVSAEAVNGGPFADNLAIGVLLFNNSQSALILFDDGFDGAKHKAPNFTDLAVRVDVDVAAIPVPAALPLMLTGLAGLYLVRRRRTLRA
ncbi:MAG: VPLPA-CTERM sorting domain-containing protein [Pseudomonadota bacterium]